MFPLTVRVLVLEWFRQGLYIHAIQNSWLLYAVSVIKYTYHAHLNQASDGILLKPSSNRQICSQMWMCRGAGYVIQYNTMYFLLVMIDTAICQTSGIRHCNIHYNCNIKMNNGLSGKLVLKKLILGPIFQ